MKTQIFTYFKYAGILLCSAILLFSCSKDDEPGNRPPKSFKLIEVADGATDVELQPQLKWEAATDPDGDKVSYQLYLDADNPPQTSIANNLDVNTLTIEDALQPKTTYYWKVVAKDINGKTTESDVFSFTTREKTTEETLIGKWFYESIEGRPPLSDCNKQSFFHFTTDLSLRIETRSQDSYSEICGMVSSSDFTYELNGNIITLDNGENIVIGSITDTELVCLIGGRYYTFRKE